MISFLSIPKPSQRFLTIHHFTGLSFITFIATISAFISLAPCYMYPKFWGISTVLDASWRNLPLYLHRKYHTSLSFGASFAWLMTIPPWIAGIYNKLMTNQWSLISFLQIKVTITCCRSWSWCRKAQWDYWGWLQFYSEFQELQHWPSSTTAF